MSKIRLPDPLYRAGPKTGDPDPMALRRIVAEITLRINDLQNLLDQLSQSVQVMQPQTDITADPRFIGQIAVDGADVYIATGLTAADWTIVS